jgi:hypothetical protein
MALVLSSKPRRLNRRSSTFQDAQLNLNGHSLFGSDTVHAQCLIAWMSGGVAIAGKEISVAAWATSAYAKQTQAAFGC